MRKVIDREGYVTGLADRTGVSIRFEDILYDIAIDGSGHLFVTDGAAAPSGRSSSPPAR